MTTGLLDQHISGRGMRIPLLTGPEHRTVSIAAALLVVAPKVEVLDTCPDSHDLSRQILVSRRRYDSSSTLDDRY